MSGIVWRSWIGPGRIGLIHNEPFLLQRIEEKIGFKWSLKRRRTGEEWRGTTIQGLVAQAYLDLHCEQYDVDSIEQTDGPGNWCPACDPEARYRVVEG
jgi:hypothetical protein